jgi:hypothetical protein
MSFTGEEVEVAWQATLRGGSTEWADVSDHYKKRYIAFANALPVKREGEPIAHENVREGDLVRGIRPGHAPGSHSNPARREATIVGEVYKSLDGRLVIGGAYLENLTDLSLIRRATPPLPIETESLIEAYEVRGVKGKWRMTLHENGNWVAPRDIDGYTFHNPKHIQEWKPADFVVREEQS